jgi:hypothetical protein
MESSGIEGSWIRKAQNGDNTSEMQHVLEDEFHFPQLSTMNIYP